MRQLVFLYNELLDETYQKQLGLSLEFISFAYANNLVIYDMNGRYIAVEKDKIKKTNKDGRVYGGLFILNNSEHYMRVLDASLICSKSVLGVNHKLDLHHRLKMEIVPINFKSVEDFLNLKYNEGDTLKVVSYVGNSENELISKHINNTVRNKVTTGFDINNFINLLIKEC